MAVSVSDHIATHAGGASSDHPIGSYMTADGSAVAGMVLRDATGSIILAACRYLFQCFDAYEAKVCAAMEGMSLALQWSHAPIIL